MGTVQPLVAPHSDPSSLEVPLGHLKEGNFGKAALTAERTLLPILVLIFIKPRYEYHDLISITWAGVSFGTL